MYLLYELWISWTSWLKGVYLYYSRSGAVNSAVNDQAIVISWEVSLDEIIHRGLDAQFKQFEIFQQLFGSQAHYLDAK